jgi:hypothetical protein
MVGKGGWGWGEWRGGCCGIGWLSCFFAYFGRWILLCYIWVYIFLHSYRLVVNSVYWFRICEIFHMCLAFGPYFLYAEFSLFFSIVSYSCRVSNICWANLEFCPLFVISVICSLNLVSNVRPVCPMYIFGQSVHCNWYTPLWLYFPLFSFIVNKPVYACDVDELFRIAVFWRTK